MTQPPGPPPPPEDEVWPAADDATVISSRETVVGETPPPVGPPPDRRIGAGMLLGLGALALVAAGILIAYLLMNRDDEKDATTTTAVVTQPVSTGVEKVAVPRLVGLKEADALVRLGEVGLRPKEVFKPTSKPNRLVVSQKPAEAKQVPKGSQVTLVIDQGAPSATVPDLRGKSFADAQKTLDAAGLDSTKTEVTSTEAPGTVVDQAPKAGQKAAKGSTVTLSVAKPDETATTTTSAATTTAAATTTTATTTRAAPTTTAPAQPTSATMPDVQGQTEQAAVSAMNSAGVLASIVFVPGSDPLGTVVGQAKGAGETVPYRSKVQINVSKGPNAQEDVSVPNAVGQTLSQAVSTMNAAGLRLIYVKYPVTSQSQAGKVVQQTPLSGGKAPKNAQILVYLGALQKQ